GESAHEPAKQRLASYERKRDFGRTPEPSGRKREKDHPDQEKDDRAEGPRFVVQRHRARRLHYDLRFEIDGVLASWAVPKGPTLDPDVKHAAIHVEDHPIEYLDFEGVIPSGQYGGGDVIVWDTGIWDLHAADDAAAAVRDGELHADVFGEKLKGRFILIRRDGLGEPGKEQWLLFHKHDEYAVKGWNPEDHPKSVLSGRTNDEVKADPERMWRSDLPPSQASVPADAATRAKGAAGRRVIGQPPAQPSAAPKTKTNTSSKATSSPKATTSARSRHRSDNSKKKRDGDDDGAGGAAQVTPPTEDELAALDDLGDSGTWEIFGQRLKLTNLNKELFPARRAAAGRKSEPAVSKREFVAYAARIAPVVLPYLEHRPLNMNRFPGGVGTQGFWNKQLPEHAPDWLPRWHRPHRKAGEADTYLVVDEPAALVWAANYGALEWHAWTARADAPDQPTYVLVDIDPGTGTSWEELLVLARLHRTALGHLGVAGQPKVTGQRGIQIWIPIRPGPSAAETSAWAEQLSHAIGDAVPELVSWKWERQSRGGHARLDYTQNAGHKTLVAPYSPRPAPGAPVSAPIDWDELDDPSLRPDGVTVRTVFGRLAERGDPFRSVLHYDQELPPIT
ncbi:MAG TPA: DNA polymerase ligase N-terminal domain-containing protein, partial [Streptosporangiaceae bacterium]|nr:DNA polymerase ligase N-terminal domain-containing protein [Streptosporangiaceae bacterium]